MARKKRHKRKYPEIPCRFCGKLLQGKKTIEMMVCSRCFKDRPEFKEARNEHQKKYWENNPSKYLDMCERRRQRYYKGGS